MTEQNLDLRALREGLPSMLEGLNERLENCLRVAKKLPAGDNRDGWLEDADFYQAAICTIAAIPSMLAENERLYGVVENKNEACGFLNDEVERLRARNTEMREALNELALAEAAYRKTHDIEGEASPKTGRAWDLMRRAGDKARAILAKTETPE